MGLWQQINASYSVVYSFYLNVLLLKVFSVNSIKHLKSFNVQNE